MIFSILSEWLLPCGLMAAGAAMGWWASSIIAAAKMRRIQIESWRAARGFYLRRYGHPEI